MRFSSRGVVLAGALAVVAVDQATKAWAETALADGQRISVLGDFLGFRLVYNAGAALSIGSGYTIVLTAVALAVTVAILRYARRLTSAWWTAVAALLLGGAVGNLIDRLARPPGFAVGHVVDFIDYNGWFVGNVADIAIVAAAVIVVGLSLAGIEPFREARSDEVPSDDARGDARSDARSDEVRSEAPRSAAARDEASRDEAAES